MEARPQQSRFKESPFGTGGEVAPSRVAGAGDRRGSGPAETGLGGAVQDGRPPGGAVGPLGAARGAAGAYLPFRTVRSARAFEVHS